MKKIALLVVGLSLLAAACNNTVTPNDAVIPSGGQEKARDVTVITNARVLGQGLRVYFQKNGSFPSQLSQLVNNGSIQTNNNGSSALFKTEDLAKFNYKASATQKQYVLSTRLETGKQSVSKVNTKPVEIIKATLLGVDCSDDYTYCLNETLY